MLIILYKDLEFNLVIKRISSLQHSRGGGCVNVCMGSRTAKKVLLEQCLGVERSGAEMKEKVEKRCGEENHRGIDIEEKKKKHGWSSQEKHRSVGK
ncbi:hypothetical protein DPEC_G00358440 [Dallia pectoralis]|uniref:Uncharacterized protein n=1 Tax=Dallia pectoralis TaxID=75939 RepID=A0ACC2F0C6_DALPE|nr:hypothetical protein DPEC_G00358440 [Dallia pectoralis]